MAKKLRNKSKRIDKLPIRVNRCFNHARRYSNYPKKIYNQRNEIYQAYVIVPIPVLNRHKIASELVYTFFKEFKLLKDPFIVPVYKCTFLNFKNISKKKLNGIKNKSKTIKSIMRKSRNVR